MANGTYIADLAVEEPPYSGKYRKVGALLYFRSHEAKVKLTGPIPEGVNVIGLFRESEKVQEAPYIEGDLFLKGVKVGHIHSQQDEVGNSMYWMRTDLQCITVKPRMQELKPTWLAVELEDI